MIQRRRRSTRAVTPSPTATPNPSPALGNYRVAVVLINFQNDTTNPLDTGFGFANAAVGVFSSYNQFSKYVEGSYVYNNTEGYVQDNYKVTNKWTLDYGVRLVHQQPQYDKLGQAANFLPEKWSVSQAPTLYLAGCAATPCTGAKFEIGRASCRERV